MRSRSHAAVGVILNWVSRQNLPPGARLPSARLLAGQLGLGFTTAELACKVLISRGLLKRNGYKLLVGAGTPVHAPVSGEVCVLSYLESFSQIAGRFLSERGVKHRVVELNHVNQPNPAPVLRKVLSEKPAGVILWMPYWIEELESMLAPVKIPMVICSDPAPPNLHQSSVSGDIYRGTKKALQHLFDLGHRHIAHVSCSKTMPLDHELAACYRNVCGQLGLKQAAQAIWQAESAFNEVLRKTMLEQRKRHPEVTALYSHGFAASLARDIFRVPGDLSVVSFLEPVIKTRPPLTHVALRNPDCVPMWACTEIISQLQSLEAGHPKRPPNRAYFDLELIERGSTRVLSSREGFSDPILPIDPISPMGRTGSMGRMAATPWDSWRKTYLY